VERDNATTRRGLYRRRLALAAVASVAIHLLLGKGLTIAHLGVDVALDAPAAGKPLTPKRKADFPLAVPRSPSAEQPIHERPLEVRIPTPERRQQPPAPRQPDRNVAERQVEERAEWMPAARLQASREPSRDVTLDAQTAAPAREQAVSSAAAAAAADLAAIDPAAAAPAMPAPTPAAAAAVPRTEPAPIASRWRPREVALLERLTAPSVAPAARAERDREAGAAAVAATTSRAAVVAADAAAADATADAVALSTAATAAVAALTPASRQRPTATSPAAAAAAQAPATADEGGPAPAATAVPVTSGRSARPAAGDSAPRSNGGGTPGRRQTEAAAMTGTGVATLDLPAANAAKPASGGGPKPAASGRPAASAPSSALTGRPRGAASDADEAPAAGVGTVAAGGGGGVSRGAAAGRTGDIEAPRGGGSTPGRSTSITSAAGADAPAVVSITAPTAAPAAAPSGGQGGVRPMPAAIGRFADAGAAAAVGSAVARPRSAAASGGDDDEGLSVSPAEADLPGGGIASRRTTSGDGPGAAETLPPARVAAAALPAEGRVRDVAAAFARRAPGRRGTDREATPAATRARVLVDRGLDFLARSQQQDGRWSLGTFAGGTPADVPKLRSDTAATGLALLSFLGAGHDHFDGPHRDTVRRGLEFLLAAQKPDGDLYLPADDLSNSCAWLYSHGIAAIALCEAVGMTGDPLVKPAAEKACGFIAASQHPTRGGWRYTPRSDADLSVSGWMLVAVRSGELGGVKTDPRTLDGVRRLLEAASTPTDSTRYAYNPLKPEQRMSPLSSACMTAVGGLMRLHTGATADDPRVMQAARLLAALPPEYGTATRKTRDSYLWYYASQVLVHTGGPEWQAWYGKLVDTLAATQESAGAKAGSWDPLGPAPDRWGMYGGRIYVTTLHLLALEVPDRRLPTFSAANR
jgi:hypothetical protein